ncbi:MAG TPA: L,D-transpeptidase family protein [Mycobacteriales bacterium]|nr:L,D-transpeptidase family protein [Mycobacteriales bacterium]
MTSVTRLLAAATASAMLLTGCGVFGPDKVSSAGAPSLPVATPLATPAPVELEPSLPPSPSASPSTTRPPRPVFLYDVRAVQNQLTTLRYYVGPVDGRKGGALRSAVMAFQKINGLGADGVVGPSTLAALKTPRQPVLKASAPAERVEVDLTKQVLYIVRGGKLARILPVSSGNGARYEQKNGTQARALTPVGWYRIQRRIRGERKADLGSLYDPQYFYKGWAIHGSNSVPPYPASHGCIRVTRTDALWLLGQIDVGTQVYLYGGRHTFPAGSTAAGTDNPTGDTPANTSPSPSPSPSPAQSTAAPSPSPSPAGSPSPQPTPSGEAGR